MFLHDGLDRAASAHPDAVAVRSGEDAWTYGELVARRDATAERLAGLGVAAGERIAVMMTNRVEFVLVVTALSRLGATVVLLSPAWRETEVRHALHVADVRRAVADGPAVGLLAGLMGDSVVDVEQLASSTGASPVPLPPPPTDPGADAVYVFSSGTTGLPKAVRHTHASLAAATQHWVTALGLTDEDSFQVATPPSHILGLLNLLAAVEARATVRLHARFDLEECLRRIASDRLTLELAVAPIALAWANHPGLEAYDVSSLRYIVWCATPVTESVAATVTARTGIGFMTAYGTSEVPVISACPVSRPDQWRLETVGVPAPGVEVRVVDLSTRRVLPAWEVGELEVRSVSAMAGYLPADNTTFTADGWYPTGDVGWLEPDGWVHLTDRSKELVKVNGFQVAPAELEAVLHGQAGVLDCAVFGVPDERTGEAPVAAVVLDPSDPPDAAALQDAVAEALAAYKRLKGVVVVDAVPRLPSGKVLRRELRQAWLEGRLG